MLSKEQLRIKYLKIRKLNYFEVNEIYFKPLISYLNKLYKKKTYNLSLYYPSNYEVNTLKLFKIINQKNNIVSLLPAITGKNKMKFHKWNYLDILMVNRYGMLEPEVSKKQIIPDIILVPLLAFDSQNNRLGYGKGYYDIILNKYLKKNKNIITIGVAFSFQKYNKLPASSFDVGLNFILTEKGMA